ncbi:60S ribosomal protein L31 [Cucurbita argyrosperma subsp. argyrosperma]|nr:60S ribosomal protein L31 [Cucurbita argyrosperma subsp. argyrosperma]
MASEVVTREYTVNLHKRLHGWASSLHIVLILKAHSRRRHRRLSRNSESLLGTTDVRVDVKLNKHTWSRGIRSVPRRVRVRIARKRNDEEDAKEEFYSLVTVSEVPAEGFKGLDTKVIDEEEN